MKKIFKILIALIAGLSLSGTVLALGGGGITPANLFYLNGTVITPLNPAWTISGANGVPYTGATGDLNLGTHNFTTTGLATLGSITITTTPSSGYVLTSDSGGRGTWQAPTGGFSNPMTTLGDIIFENATPVADRLAGNITTTKKYLQSVGNTTISSAPSWQQIAYGDISGTPDLTHKLSTTDASLSAVPAIAGNDGKVLGLTSGALAWVTGGGGGTWTRTLSGDATTYFQEPQATTDRILLGGAIDDGTNPLQVTGAVIATSFSGGGANLTALAPAHITGYPSDGTKVLLGNGTWGTLSALGAFWAQGINTLYPTTSTDRMLIGGAVDDTTSALQVSGTVKANYFSGDGSSITGISFPTSYTDLTATSHLYIGGVGIGGLTWDNISGAITITSGSATINFLYDGSFKPSSSLSISLGAGGYYFSNTFTQDLNLGSSSNYSGYVVCYTSGQLLGHCTSDPTGGSGTCSCSAN